MQHQHLLTRLCAAAAAHLDGRIVWLPAPEQVEGRGELGKMLHFLLPSLCVSGTDCWEWLSLLGDVIAAQHLRLMLSP